MRSRNLEVLWKTARLSSPCLPTIPTVCRLHSWTRRVCHKNYISAIAAQQYRRSSNVVKSPYKEIEIPQKFIPELVWETVDRFPESIAVKCGLTGRSYKFAEVKKLSLRFAKSLQKAGFSQGDIIAVVLPNCPEFAIITLGALELEMGVSLINHVYTPDEICYQLTNSGSVCVVTAVEKLSNVFAAITKIENATHSKPIKRIITVDIPSPQSLPSGVSRFSEMIADNVEYLGKCSYTITSNDLAFLPYSSGTTGLAKGVCLTHRNIICNILQLSTIKGLEMFSSDSKQDIILGVLPFFHIYGLVVILLNSLTCGSQILTFPKFEQDSFINALANEKLSVLMMVPPLMLFLGASPKIKAEHLANVRRILSGAAPLGSSDIEKIKSKLPSQSNCYISQAYGMTESSPVLTAPEVPAKNMATVGRPVSNTMGKVIDPNTGDTLGPNQSGELLFKGPQIMKGYHNNPKATAETIDAEGWLRTGDIGYYDEEGYFYIQDRLKELIKVKGFQVAPAELEELLRTHPQVSDVGVIGVPCPRSGEVPVAYIVPQKDKDVSAQDIKEFISEKVSRHKQVAEVFFIDTIPKSAAGKILRKDLRNLYKKENLK